MTVPKMSENLAEWSRPFPTSIQLGLVKYNWDFFIKLIKKIKLSEFSVFTVAYHAILWYTILAEHLEQ